MNEKVIPEPISSSVQATRSAPASTPSRRFGLARRLALWVREQLMRLRLYYFREIMKMDIHPDVRISLKANLDQTNPRGIHIGEGTYVAFSTIILAHDMSRVRHTDTYIGRNCFIGAGAIIMPGVRVGDECIVGSGAVVTKDVPSHSIVAGNPAAVVRAGIRTVKWGILENAYRDALAAESKIHSQPLSD
jgi:acetyltransferase-like isoleucine patch superfamily enzyme